MKIAAITRFKQGELWEALQKAGWNQSELGRRAGIRQGDICDFINLKRRPSEEKINQIQSAFAEEGIYIDTLAIWPEGFNGIGRRLELTQVKEVPLSHLIESNARLIEGQHAVVDDLIKKENIDRLNAALARLSFREREVVKLRYGIGEYIKYTLDEVARIFKVTRERVRQLENKGIRKLQAWYEEHPEE